MKRYIICLLLFSGIIYSGNAHAQSNGNAPLILQLPTSTRAAGLGGAYVLSSADADAIFAAPSVLRNARGSSLSVQQYDESSTLASLSTTVSWGGGVLAFGVQSLTYSTVNRRLSDVNNDYNILFNSNRYGASSLVTSIGYAKTIKGISYGVVGKYIEQRIETFSDGTNAIDFGASKYGKGVTWSLNAQNLGPGLEILDDLPLPRKFSFGASTRNRQFGPIDYIVSTNVSHLEGGDVVPAAGLEISYWPIRGRTFTGRIGLRDLPDDASRPITFGAAFTNDNITFEYAFENYDNFGHTHRFGIRWR